MFLTAVGCLTSQKRFGTEFLRVFSPESENREPGTDLWHVCCLQLRQSATNSSSHHPDLGVLSGPDTEPGGTPGRGWSPKPRNSSLDRQMLDMEIPSGWVLASRRGPALQCFSLRSRDREAWPDVELRVFVREERRFPPEVEL